MSRKLKRARKSNADSVNTIDMDESIDELDRDSLIDDQNTLIPQWIHEADKSQIQQVLKGKYSTLTVEKMKGQGQSTSFSSLSIRVVGTEKIYRTSQVMCDYCSSILNNNGGHLKRHRELRCESAKEKKKESIADEATKIATKADFDKSLVNYFSKTGQPLYSLENEAFRELLVSFAHLGQGFEGKVTDDLILKRTTARSIVDTCLDEKEAEIYQLLRPHFENRSATVLADFGKLNYDFLGIKVAFVEEDTDQDGTPCWRLVVAPLAMAPLNMKSKEANEVYKAIKTTLEKCYPTVDCNDYFLVADGGSNIRSAGKLFFSRYIRCAAHASELIGKRMLNPYKKDHAAEFEKKLLSKYVNLFDKAKQLTAIIKCNKHLYKELEVSLVTPTDTRWMTSYTCTRQVFTNMNKLIAHSHKIGEKAESLILDLSTTESRKLFDEIDAIYGPIKESNDHFQSNTTTIADVIPVYLGLLDDCNQLSGQTDETAEYTTLLEYASKAIKKQIRDLVDVHYLAYYLHPGYKCLEELQKRLDKHNVMMDVSQKVNAALKYLDKQLNDDLTTCQEPSTSGSQSNSSDSFVSRRLKKTPPPSIQSIIHEKKLYEADMATNDPLYFWIESKKRYPRMFNIAKKVFSTPASEADVERSFSCLKNIYNDKRRSLNLNYLQKLMLVKQFDQLN